MSSERRPDARTTGNQRRASDPALSAWVSAHAGSGKTHVLSSRVIRLLLEGVPPSRILCLTFTKAAAANMSGRVFKTLARWAVASDEDLASEIAKVGANAPADLSPARTLFARAVETPGGLKIQTIHAFCERILHLFPFEANVAADFRVLDDVEKDEMLERAKYSALLDIARDGHPLKPSLELVASRTWDGGFDELLKEMIRYRHMLDGKSLEQRAHDVRMNLGLGQGESETSIAAEIFNGGIPFSDWRAVAAKIAEGSANDVKCAKRLIEAADSDDDQLRADKYLDVFLTKDKSGYKPRETIVTKAVGAKHSALAAALDLEKTRVFGLRDSLCAARILTRTLALDGVARVILQNYENAKRARGLLDFDDLIAKANTLLHRAEASNWVLYKLDGGIDHILVDEAQDTSEPQWRILEALAQEFWSGEGRPRPQRTFFAVGDEKQSIFSFNGADPAMFDRMRRTFEKRLSDAGKRFEHVALHMSFRSVPEILSSVDDVFANPAFRQGLFANAATVEMLPHEALKAGVPGLVEIWPPIGAAERSDDEHWTRPVDTPAETDPPVRLARKIAEKIARLIDPAGGDCVEDRPGVFRPIGAGDIMILVRKRDAFFEAVIRALKDRNVPVAGADRLDVAGHISVMDCIAVGRAALLPDDDLTLATVLKTPFIGLDDDDLIALAPKRPATLRQALEASGAAAHRSAANRLAHWRVLAADLTPFDFFMRLLGAEGGRKAILSRLGPEANDALDAFLALALEHERSGPPSLANFLSAMESLDLKIKRDMETSGAAVRVLTVHGAKGLEAKIVFLPDTCSAPTGQHDPKLLPLGGEDCPVWAGAKDNDSSAVTLARERLKQQREDEYRRLLYVALTRAEERLYISGQYNARKPAEICWHTILTAALARTCEEIDDPLEPGASILRRGTLLKAAPATGSPPSAASPGLPDWLRAIAPTESEPAPPLRPSSALSGADSRDHSDKTRNDLASARARGIAIHALFRRLPDVSPEARSSSALRYLAGALPNDPASHGAIADSVLRIIEDPTLAPLFGPESLAEVPIAAGIERKSGPPLQISGQIDRFAECGNEIWVADFKSGAPSRGPASPAHVTQIALYAAALGQIYQGRSVRALLIYIGGPEAVTVSPESLALSLATALAGT